MLVVVLAVGLAKKRVETTNGERAARLRIILGLNALDESIQRREVCNSRQSLGHKEWMCQEVLRGQYL